MDLINEPYTTICFLTIPTLEQVQFQATRNQEAMISYSWQSLLEPKTVSIH